MSISPAPTAVMYGPTWKSSIPTTRSPSAPRITTCAFAAEQTAERSSAASAWHSEPPIVPRLRTTGSAITCLGVAEQREALARAARTSSRSTCRVSAPILISPSCLADVGELGEVVDVDQVLGVGEPQLHHRQQAVAAGDDPRLGAEPLERRDRALDAGRALVLEWRRGLQLRSSRIRTLGREPLARRADVVALLVLDRGVGADHRRARQVLRARLADARVEQPRREAAALDVAQHRAGRAGGGDRRLAAEPRERERALACRPRRSAAPSTSVLSGKLRSPAAAAPG